MKKLFTLIVMIAINISVFAQLPQKMSYQAVIRDADQKLVANHVVGMKISILQGSAVGTAVYVETQTPTTNVNGLVTIEIGGGTPVVGTFAGINWSTGTYYIKTETDPGGGTSYTITGTSQVLSVPYSLYSKTAGNGSLWSQDGSNIYYNSGNVGIRTSTPEAFLNIMGNSNIGLPHLLLTESEGDYARLTFKNTDAVTKNWSIAGLPVAADANSRLNFWYWNGSTGADLMTITGSGNVGIGTTNPGALLQVHSNTTYVSAVTPIIKISDNFKAWNIGLGDPDDRFSITSEDNTERLTIMKLSGYVGIGTASPAAGLHIKASTWPGSFIYLESDAAQDAGMRLNEGPDVKWHIFNDASAGGLLIQNNGLNVSLFCQQSNGNVGIGTTTPGYTLTVNGTAWCSSGAWTGSDIRWKKNIIDLNNSLSDVLELKAVSYDLKTDEFPQMRFETGRQIGLIAQDVEKVLPELVRTDNNGYKSVSYEKLSVLLVESIKEQQKQIQDQQKEIDELRTLVKDLISDQTSKGDK